MELYTKTELEEFDYELLQEICKKNNINIVKNENGIGSFLFGFDKCINLILEKQDEFKLDEPNVELEEEDIKVEEKDNIIIDINLNVNAEVGEEIYMVGNIVELGNWDYFHAKKLEKNGKANWVGDISIKKGQEIEFKFIKKTATGIIWENGENRIFKDNDAEIVAMYNTNWK